MKQEQIQSHAHYQAPALKLFQITLEGGCCQAVSPLPPSAIDPGEWAAYFYEEN
jgi:hypothetical protein